MNNFLFLIKPLGITTYALILLTLLSGLLRWKLKFHRGLAISATILATVHAALVLLGD